MIIARFDLLTSTVETDTVLPGSMPSKQNPQLISAGSIFRLSFTELITLI